MATQLRAKKSLDTTWPNITCRSIDDDVSVFDVSELFFLVEAISAVCNLL